MLLNQRSLFSSLDELKNSQQLLEYLVNLTDAENGIRTFSSFSPAIYDTAWLSTVHRTSTDGKIDWLFPQCWQYILATQTESGSWSSYSSHIDGILNTAASLLALLIRAVQDPASRVDYVKGQTLQNRIERAKEGLQKLLDVWNVAESVHVGFEVLVPRLLDQISAFDMHFSFPGQRHLQRLYEKKMKKFKPSLLYSSKQCTLLHSLEGFVGYEGFDFEKVRHHCRERTGMMGSPAATAAYLMQVKEWDPAAEVYLRRVVQQYWNAVPSAFPTEIFEFSWALTTVLPRLLSLEDIKTEHQEKLRICLEGIHRDQAGLVGFTLDILPDADDSARILMARAALGENIDLRPLLKHFETETHMRTYEIEGSASFSANCNILLAILASGQPREYISSISKIMFFLLGQWETGRLVDKWNMDQNYLCLLFAEAIVKLLQALDTGNLSFNSAALEKSNLVAIISQILGKTLCGQRPDGSWNGSGESTAYAGLVLAQCLSLPWTDPTRQRLEQSIRMGREYLSSVGHKKSNNCDYSWIEKVSYQSALLRKCYIICSVEMPMPGANGWSAAFRGIFNAAEAPHGKKPKALLSLTPLFQTHNMELFELILLEASSYAQRLRKWSTNIFPRESMPFTKDNYLEMIPTFWVACNHIGAHALTPETLWEMCVLSLLNYQVDEYMETAVAGLSAEATHHLKMRLKQACQRSKERTSKIAVENGITSNDELSSALQIFGVLERYVSRIVDHAHVRRLPESVRTQLLREVRKFLLAHISHNRDSQALRLPVKNSMSKATNGHMTTTPDDLEKHSRPRAAPERSFFEWVTTTGATDTSCPFSLLFFSCLISAPNTPCTSKSPQAAYLFQALGQHLATMCRMYNDYGSVERDKQEYNLNSIDFPEFSAERLGNGYGSECPAVVRDGDRATALGRAKSQLINVAQFEKSCMELALQSLEALPEVEEAVIRKLRVFINVTDLWGQVYVVKDIASRKV